MEREALFTRKNIRVFGKALEVILWILVAMIIALVLIS